MESAVVKLCHLRLRSSVAILHSSNSLSSRRAVIFQPTSSLRRNHRPVGLDPKYLPLLRYGPWGRRLMLRIRCVSYNRALPDDVIRIVEYFCRVRRGLPFGIQRRTPNIEHMHALRGRQNDPLLKCPLGPARPVS